jgi:hypothetical protein
MPDDETHSIRARPGETDNFDALIAREQVFPKERWDNPGETYHPFRIHNHQRDDILNGKRILYTYGNTVYYDLSSK